MQLTINGNLKTMDSATTVAQMLTVLELDAGAVVVELNREIIRRPELGTTPINDGDVVEIVHFVGGG